jgi:phosphoenolpyruvate carboxylase
MGTHPLPRAINFTAAFYSLGIPPEFIGLGRMLKSLSYKELDVLSKYYVNLKTDLVAAGRYINHDNLRKMALSNKAWKLIEEDIELTQHILDLDLGPKTQSDLLHHNLATSLFLQKNKKAVVSRLIVETGKLRRSLG